MREVVGVLGSGSFGVTIATLLAHNTDVIIYTRRESVVEDINVRHHHYGVDLPECVSASSSLQEIGEKCQVIFPVIPSSGFRSVIRAISPYLKPSHILIHCTKGLDLSAIAEEDYENAVFTKQDVFTMSEVIRQESTVIRVGCMSGPNLAKEILAGQPAATVIASEFQEVIRKGQKILTSENFFAFGSYDMKGAELAGAYKNIIAVASGILGGLNLGKNIQALLITRGLREMIQFGMAMGTTSAAYLGTAGIGDLIATATSENSRNYTFGKRLAGGEGMKEILKTSDEVVEGVRTLKIIYHLSRREHLRSPILNMLYRVIYEEYDLNAAIKFLMSYTYAPDVDWI
jgi:glycerol-3-phosphate dehydrogenase (NAD(P)+)